VSNRSRPPEPPGPPDGGEGPPKPKTTRPARATTGAPRPPRSRAARSAATTRPAPSPAPGDVPAGRPLRPGETLPPGVAAARPRKVGDPLPATRQTSGPDAGRDVVPAAAQVGGPPVAGPAAPPGARPVPKVQRTCYEVRLMVCPRDPATCPETWPVGERVLCGSFEMLARFEKEGGGEDLTPEAGLDETAEGLTITSRPDQDPEEREDDEAGDEDEER
jgi:hypothetical protein